MSAYFIYSDKVYKITELHGLEPCIRTADNLMPLLSSEGLNFRLLKVLRYMNAKFINFSPRFRFKTMFSNWKI